MPISVNGVQVFTSAEQLTLWQNASAQLAISESTTVQGRTITRANAQEVRDMIQFWEERVALEASANGGSIALVQYGNPNGGQRRDCW